MVKIFHEIRDPIHNFIKLDFEERKVVDSRPFQRLRNICQLAFTYLVYPGTTHKRFEHSLGVMELATRIYDSITNEYNIHPKIKKLNLIPSSSKEKKYWRRVLRMAALCHDLGHLPFSHAAEEEIFPKGWNHERMTYELICSSEMEEIWNKMTPPLRSEDIVKIALGKRDLSEIKEVEFKDWEIILSEIIVSDTFGADRMDYLLRDSYHAGVVYGLFGHYRLIDTLKILLFVKEPYLGIEIGGLNSAEALLLARYFMFSQLYFHSVRRIYDNHLKEFLVRLFPKRFPTKVNEFLKWTDNEILVKICEAANDPRNKLHSFASIIANRKHFKLLYRRNPEDLEMNATPDLNPGEKIYKEACKKIGAENLHYDWVKPKGSFADFPVELEDGRIVSARNFSQVLNTIPINNIEYIFVDRKYFDDAIEWLRKERVSILKKKSC